MKLEANNSDQTILEELGRRLARTRLERNISQGQLATEAGISKSTVERIEAGQAVKLTSFVRILRALGQIDVLDRLLPEPLPSPIERLRLQGRQRQRAALPRGGSPAEPEPWRWDADPPGDSR